MSKPQTRIQAVLPTGEVLASHEAALGDQDADRISAHYAEDAVLVANGASWQMPARGIGWSLIADPFAISFGANLSIIPAPRP